MSPTFLVELGCEELPATACDAALAQAGELVARLLADRRLDASSVDVHVAPRRIAVLAHDVPREQAEQTLEHRGPPDRLAFDEEGRPTRAAEGFARRHGLDASGLERRDGFAWATVEAGSEPALSILPDVVQGLVTGLQLPKNMRWGSRTLRFARPIRWIVALLGDDVVPVEIAGVRAGRETRGHRFLSPEPLSLPGPDDYLAALRGAFVVADPGERRSRIVTGLHEAGVRFSDPADVLSEVVHLAEWPSVLRGSFDPRYLDLPDRALVAAMQSHQRYFPLEDENGSRLPGFLFVANSGPEAAASVIAGNERVLRGRLDDASFSFARDLERGLEAMAASLDRITYHARAGTVADRVQRLVALVDPLADAAGAPAREREAAREAARLCKADLASTLVDEFPELQGYAGCVYARRGGLPDDVAIAIGEHYRPQGADAARPETGPGVLVALADKLDSLATAFALGEIPTGSRDPYGLRRAATGVVLIALDRELHLPLRPLVLTDLARLREQGADLHRDDDETARDVVSFVLDRVDGLLEADGIGIDLLRAARGAGGDDPLAHAQLARALHRAAERGSLDRARTALERSRRIAARSADEAAAALDESLLTEDAEQQLAAALRRAAPALAQHVAARDLDAALAQAAELAPAVDRFFEDVLVMADDPAVRANRLRLLLDLADATRALGDLSEVQGVGDRS